MRTRSLQEAIAAAMLETTERERYARAAKEKSNAYDMDEVAKDYAAIYDRRSKGQKLITTQQYA